jgi:hypothetical protein
MTTPAAETMPIGLPADAQLSWFLQAPSGQFYHDVTTSCQLSGQLYRDTEILPTYRDFAKTTPSADTDGNSLSHWAVMWHSSQNQRLSAL